MVLLRSISNTSTTPWKQLLKGGTSSDFSGALNFDHHSFFNVLLPVFEKHRALTNFGSPYRRGPKLNARQSSAKTVYLGLILWYLKSSLRQYNLFPVFGLVLISVNVWVYYALEVMYNACRSKKCAVLKVQWPTVSEIKAFAAFLENN